MRYKCPECGRGWMSTRLVRNHGARLGGLPLVVPLARLETCDACGATDVSGRELARWGRLQEEERLLGKSFKTSSNGDRHWYGDDRNRLHRADGPACEHADGHKGWWRHGKCHRDGGPAVERPDGTKEWYVDGEFQRREGPP